MTQRKFIRLNINDNYLSFGNVFRIIKDKNTKEVIGKELILKNHSKVMYDYNLIPKDEIRENL